jgi:hypothetical protein
MRSKIISIALLICLQVGSVFFAATAFAQKNQITSELGIGLGGINYKGEIAPKYRFGNNQPAVTVFYRRDISAPITLRASALLGGIAGTDNYFELPLNQFRQARMRGTLLEVAAGLEYNFLDFYDLRRRKRWTPYYFLNVAGFYASTNTESSAQGSIAEGSVSNLVAGNNAMLSIAVPTGVGVKYALSHHWNLGLEIGARLIFTDLLDNLGDTTPLPLANPHDNDWYFYNGISISYTFYKIPCPKVYRSKPSPLE